MSFVITYAKNATMDEIMGLGECIRKDIVHHKNHEPKKKHVMASQRPTILSAPRCTARASYAPPEHSPREV
jgi:hypothetical protein